MEMNLVYPLYNCKKDKPDVREKVLKHGINFTFDVELIMLILGSGNKKMPVTVMAQKIIDILDRSNKDDVVENLLELKGIGQGKALAIVAALELGRRRNNHLKAPIRTASDVVPFVKNYAVSLKEHFLLITLNGGYEIIQIHVISVGTLNRTLIHPREICCESIKENAAAIIVCHNHPSGNCLPSDEDIETTKILLSASEIIGIKLLDHIIIDCESYFSFAEHKLLFYGDK